MIGLSQLGANLAGGPLRPEYFITAERGRYVGVAAMFRPKLLVVAIQAALVQQRLEAEEAPR